MHRTSLVMLALGLLLACAAPSLKATVLLPAEFRQIVDGSQLIVYGRVTDVRPEWMDGRRRIESVVTVEVGSYLKGGPGQEVTFRAPGGQIGRYKSLTVGAPEFRPGDEAVFFLTARGPSVARVFGLSQGVFRVRVDASGRRLVVPPAVMAAGDRAQRVTRGSIERKSLSLDAFAGQVRTAMVRKGAER